ncbi:hypothetical protein E1B28_005061 [Marasmius oreades]|uniref:BZIP domain-containing protein n=1 Tax=Marasmius oreades TaxID=181124 RepID=A0A9P8ADL6_9AGAR|nr:uncharacterized protein E1B28_005061 [Marasmius oreades]KAG7097739.1 hypothetical protein E1B28_005061 [Marasmius oreades]
MLVDNPLAFFSPLPTMTTTNESDFSEFLNTELFGPSSSSALNSTSMTSATPGSPEHSTSPSSGSSSPTISLLTTPPQQPLHNSFPEIHADDPYALGSPNSILNFLNEDWKMDSSMGLGMGGVSAGSAGSFGANGNLNSMNPLFLPPAEFDLVSALTSGASNPVTDVNMASAAAATTSTSSSQMAIDPQLVDSPTESGKHDSDDEGEASSSEMPSMKKASTPEPAITIAPVKVGGHGKSRKGTVQSGGITKKQAASTHPSHSSTTATPTSTATATKNKENLSAKKSAGSNFASEKDNDIDEDDLPADWRPPPEVFQKMSSKEKRQLRNKISARNFRVRRKEYISTLELDIAERDRVLQAIRSELGSTQSENFALRQEIAALKKALLEGRPTQSSPQAHGMVKGAGEGMDVNLNAVNGVTLEDFLPPPAPLPERSAADEILARAAAAAAASSSASSPNATSSSSPSSFPLVTPNTQKDVSLSTSQAAFWGGVGGGNYGHGFGLGGGVTPVHTVLMPEISSAGLRHQQQEDLNVSKWVRDVLAAQAQASMEEDEEPSHHYQRRLQENMNPAMNGSVDEEEEEHNGSSLEFERFVEENNFTMKSIDAYRMHLWTKMAASHQPSNTRATKQTPPPPPPLPPTQSPTIPQKKYHPDRISSPSPFAPFPSQSPSPPLPSHYLTSPHLVNPKAQLTNRSLASQLKPHYFMSSQKPNLPSSSSSASTSTPPNYSSLSFSKMLGTGFLGNGVGVGSGLANKRQTHSASSATTAEQQQQMMYAATATLASQTLLGKLGGAFWDAFSGSTSTTKSSTPGSGGGGVGGRSWDADKVRKVLEGKAVVRVVDVDDGKSYQMSRESVVKKEVGLASPVLGPSPSLVRRDAAPASDPTEWLEEKMKQLSLAKKN